jgi:hypothetical protein
MPPRSVVRVLFLLLLAFLARCAPVPEIDCHLEMVAQMPL